MIFGIKTDIIICGDININYLKDSSYKQQLDSLLVSLGLSSIVQFSTRIQNNSYSIIDNIFINTSKFTNYTVYPIINGLSDHDAQNLIIHNIFNQHDNRIEYKREINDATIADFNNKLSYESWEDVFAERDINTAFNIFFNIYLTIFHSSFPVKTPP
jgi:hypothetical protein